MRRRLGVTFTFDDRGRIVLTNEPSPDARQLSPELVMGVVDAGSILLVSTRLPETLVARIESGSQDVRAVERELSTFGRWRVGGGPVYCFPEDLDSSEAFELAEVHRPLLRQYFAWLDEEFGLWGTMFGIARDGAIVSVCFSSRLHEGAAEAGLQTASEYRGQGLAQLVTAGWAASTRASGRIPFYSTSRQNTASQSVARKLGLMKIGEDYTWSLL
jgi:GNAT superfamily N-acetyltransferase